ncbi:MAG: tetratricopeptide repeat protein, partial [Planctomycetes bacterium]|nr:tetratricopeptide repeat protein [Planctomycetota bacterium]
MARKKLNRRFVIGLTLFTFLSMIALSALMLRQLQKGDPDQLAVIGKKHADAGEWHQAFFYYQRAYKKGGHVDHLVAAGNMLLKDDEVGYAIGAWRDALVQQPDLLSAHHQLLDTLLELSRIHDQIRSWTAVRKAAVALLAVDLSADDKAYARHAEGLALVKLSSQSPEFGDLGLAALEEAAELAPRIVDYAIDLARLRVARGFTEEGAQTLRALLVAHGDPSADAAKVRTAFAQFLASQARIEESADYHEEALRMAVGDDEALSDAKLAHADFLIRRWARAKVIGDEEAADGFFMTAEALMRECIAIDRESFAAFLQLAILYQAAGRHVRVIETCDERLADRPPRKGLEATENQLSTFRLLILASEASVAEAVAAQREDHRTAQRDWLTKSRNYLEQADSEYPDHPKVLGQRGRILLAEGRDRHALEVLREADDAYRSYDILNWDNTLRLARVHMSLNEPGAALTVLEEVADMASGRQAVVFWKLYVRVLLRNTDALDTFDDSAAQKAETALAKVELHDPNDSDLPNLRAAIFERMGKTRQAQELIESPTDKVLLSARSLAEDGEMDRALQVVREALRKTPTDARLVTTAVNELIRQEDVEAARSIIDQARELDPGSILFKRLAVLTRDEMTPVQRDQALLEIIESHDDAYQRAWDLIDFYWRRGNFAAALPHFDQAEKHLVDQDTPIARNATKGQHRALLKAKMFLAARLDNEPAMAAARDSAARHEVDGAGGKSLLGLYHMYRDEIDQATIAFSSAIEKQPTDARLLSYLGHCYHRAGRIDDAWITFDRAVQMNPGEGTAHKGLAEIAKLRGEEDAFQTHLAICARLLPADTWVQDELLAKREGEDPRRAIQDRERRLANDPDDARNLARLAELSEKVGDLERADRFYDRLLVLHPEKKDVAGAVAKYYRRTDRPELALKLVTQFAGSRKTSEDQAEAMILIAAHHLSQQQTDDVEATLLRAADLSTTLSVCRALADFYLRSAKRPKEALIWLEKAVARARDEKSPRLAQILGARIVCVLHRAVYDLDAARRHVDEFIREFPDDPRGLLWDAEIHSRIGRIESAIESLTRYLTIRPGNAYALFQRAQHHAAMGRTPAAIADLETLKQTDPTALGLEPRVFLARLHVQAGRHDQWVEELESIVKDAPESEPAIQELVGAYIQTKRFRDADRLVTAQLNRAGDGPDAKWYFLRGRVSLQLDRMNDALRDYQEGAKLAEFSEQALADVLSLYLRAAQFAEGVLYFETHASEENQTSTTLARYAHLLAKSGAEDKAVASFRKAVVRALSSESRLVVAVVREVVRAFAPKMKVVDVAELFENTA